MKTNLKAFPKQHTNIWPEPIYQKWRNDFETELREEIKLCERWLHADGRIAKWRYIYMKDLEILGED